MAIRYILFDAAGTLIYPEPSVATAYEAVGKSHGLLLNAGEIKPRFAAAYARVFRQATNLSTDEAVERQRWRAVVAEVFYESPQLVDELLEQLWQHFARPEHWPLFEDVMPAWTALVARGYWLGIASNFDGRLRQILAGHACLSSCRQIFVSTELGCSKPSQEFFRAIQRRLEVPPEKILIVGDDEENDVLAPRRAGWQSMALDRTGSSRGSLSSLLELTDCLP